MKRLTGSSVTLLYLIRRLVLVLFKSQYDFGHNQCQNVRKLEMFLTDYDQD